MQGTPHAAARRMAQVPAPGAQPLSAPGQHPGMDKPRGTNSGGHLIRGPGTGTSDSIPAQMRPGSFIMPADSTQSLGARALSSLGKKVPVNVSNGEYEYTPEQVHAVGIRALSQMKDATHMPVQGPASGSDERGFSVQHLDVGGEVFGSRGLSQLRDLVPKVQEIGYPQNPAQPPAFSPPQQRQPASFGDAAAAQRDPGVTQVGAAPAVAQSVLQTDPQAQSDRASLSKMASSIGDANQNAGRAILDMATMVPRGLAGAYDSAVVRPMRAAGINAGYLSPHLVPDGVDPASMTPFTDQKRIRDGNQEAAGSSSMTVPATNSTAPDALTDVQRGGGSAPALTDTAAAPSPSPSPAPGAATAMQTIPGVYNHGPGQYSDSASSMGMPASFTGHPNSQNMAAADSLAARGFSPNATPSATDNPTRGFTTPTIANSTNNWQAANDLRNARVSASSITANGGRFDQTRKGQLSPQAATYAAMLGTDQALQQAQPGMAKAAMDANAGLQREGMQQTGENQRTSLREQGFATRDKRKAGLDERALAMQEQAAGFKTRAQAQLESLRGTLLDPNATTDQKAQAQAQLSALNGGQNGEWGVQVTPATKNVDGSTTAGSIVKYNKRTGETATVGDSGPTVQIDKNSQALAIKDNPSLTREQKVDALRKLGYS